MSPKIHHQIFSTSFTNFPFKSFTNLYKWHHLRTFLTENRNQNSLKITLNANKLDLMEWGSVFGVKWGQWASEQDQFIRKKSTKKLKTIQWIQRCSSLLHRKLKFFWRKTNKSESPTRYSEEKNLCIDVYEVSRCLVCIITWI